MTRRALLCLVPAAVLSAFGWKPKPKGTQHTISSIGEIDFRSITISGLDRERALLSLQKSVQILLSNGVGIWTGKEYISATEIRRQWEERWNLPEHRARLERWQNEVRGETLHQIEMKIRGDAIASKSLKP